MAKLLHIETSTKNCSVSLSDSEKLLAVKEYASLGYSHAEKLHLFIKKILKDNNTKLADLDGIAISAGPGSYTGLRIGVSTAKGLAFALNIPLISVPTLEHISYQIKQKDVFIIPMIDARRMEVYSAVYNDKHIQVREVRAEIINENSYKNYLDKKKVIFLGDATEKVKEVIKHPNAVFSNKIYPSAREMVNIAHKKYKQNDFENTAYFEPFYLKDFIAVKKNK